MELQDEKDRQNIALMGSYQQPDAGNTAEHKSDVNTPTQ